MYWVGLASIIQSRDVAANGSGMIRVGPFVFNVGDAGEEDVGAADGGGVVWIGPVAVRHEGGHAES